MLARLLAIMIGGCAAFAVLSVTVLDRGETVVLPEAEVVARLTAKERVVNGTGLGSLSIRSLGARTGAVVLAVERAGSRQAVTCRVAIRPVSARRSRADAECPPPETGSQAAPPVAYGMLTVVVREHVAATLAERPFDVDRIADAMIALALAKGPAMLAAMPPRDREPDRR